MSQNFKIIKSSLPECRTVEIMYDPEDKTYYERELEYGEFKVTKEENQVTEDSESQTIWIPSGCFLRSGKEIDNNYLSNKYPREKYSDEYWNWENTLESVKYKLNGKYSVDYWIDDYRVGVGEELNYFEMF